MRFYTTTTMACAMLAAACGAEQESARDTSPVAETSTDAASPAAVEQGPQWEDYCLGDIFRVALPTPPREADVPAPAEGGFRGWTAEVLRPADSISYMARTMWKPSSSPGTYAAAGFFEVLSRNRDVLSRVDTTFDGLDAVWYQLAAGPNGAARNTGLVVSRDTILYILAAVTSAGSHRFDDADRFLNSLSPESCAAM